LHFACTVPAACDERIEREREREREEREREREERKRGERERERERERENERENERERERDTCTRPSHSNFSAAVYVSLGVHLRSFAYLHSFYLLLLCSYVSFIFSIHMCM